MGGKTESTTRSLSGGQTGTGQTGTGQTGTGQTGTGQTGTGQTGTGQTGTGQTGTGQTGTGQTGTGQTGTGQTGTGQTGTGQTGTGQTGTGQTGTGQTGTGQTGTGQTGTGQTGTGQTGMGQMPHAVDSQIPTDIKCSSKEQYDLNSQICEEVGITGVDVFKIIVKGGEHMTDKPGKVQVWVLGNDVTKVRTLSQSSLSAPAGISFEFQPDIVKINDSFTVCYRPLANLAVEGKTEPVCIDGSNSPEKKPEIITLQAR